MSIRSAGCVIAAAGWAAILWWGATAGSHPTALAGSFDVPAIGFLVVMAGFFVWLVGMVRGERADLPSWRDLDRRQAPAGYLDTFVFRALAATSSRLAASGPVRAVRVPIGTRPASAEPPPVDTAPGTEWVPAAARRRPLAAATPAARRPRPSPVALAVLDSIELRRLETGEAPLPIDVRRVTEPDPGDSAGMPRPATAAARARA